MASWMELLSGAELGEHVSRYLAEGLRRGDGLVVIATLEHTRGIVGHLVEGSS